MPRPPGQAPTGVLHRLVLPAGRVRRRPEGHEAPQGGGRAHRLPAEQVVPGGHAAQHVRVPGRSRTPPCPTCSPSSPSCRRRPCRCRRTTSPPTATSGSTSGPTSCCDDAAPGARVTGPDHSTGRRRPVPAVAGRWALAACRPRFLAVFFAWPVADDHRPRAVARRPRRRAHRSRPPLRRLVHAVAGRRSAPSLTVVVALPGAYVMARYRFAGRRPLLALVTVPFVLPTVVVGAAFLAAAARRACTTPSGPSSSPTSSSTTPSSCARSARCGRTSTRGSRRRPGCSARRGGGRSARSRCRCCARRSTAAGVDRVPLHVHVVRRRAASSAARATRRSRSRSTGRRPQVLDLRRRRRPGRPAAGRHDAAARGGRAARSAGAIALRLQPEAVTAAAASAAGQRALLAANLACSWSLLVGVPAGPARRSARSRRRRATASTYYRALGQRGRRHEPGRPPARRHLHVAALRRGRHRSSPSCSAGWRRPPSPTGAGRGAGACSTPA